MKLRNLKSGVRVNVSHWVYLDDYGFDVFVSGVDDGLPAWMAGLLDNLLTSKDLSFRFLVVGYEDLVSCYKVKVESSKLFLDGYVVVKKDSFDKALNDLGLSISDINNFKGAVIGGVEYKDVDIYLRFDFGDVSSAVLEANFYNFDERDIPF